MSGGTDQIALSFSLTMIIHVERAWNEDKLTRTHSLELKPFIFLTYKMHESFKHLMSDVYNHIYKHTHTHIAILLQQISGTSFNIRQQSGYGLNSFR